MSLPRFYLPIGILSVFINKVAVAFHDFSKCFFYRERKNELGVRGAVARG